MTRSRRLTLGIAAVCSLLLTAAGGSYFWLAGRYEGFASTASPATRLVPPPGTHVLHFGFDGMIGDEGVPAPWQFTVIHGRLDVETVRLLTPADGDATVLHVRSDKAHYLVWEKVPPYDPAEYPVLTWSWRAETLPVRGDVRTHSAMPIMGDNRNDKALQVLVAFDGKYTINYSWDTTAAVGTEVTEWSPVTEIKTRVVHSGAADLRRWVQQRVDVRDDFRRLYGHDPGHVVGLSVQTNSNHTGSSSDGYVGPISALRQ